MRRFVSWWGRGAGRCAARRRGKSAKRLGPRKGREKAGKRPWKTTERPDGASDQHAILTDCARCPTGRGLPCPQEDQTDAKRKTGIKGRTTDRGLGDRISGAGSVAHAGCAQPGFQTAPDRSIVGPSRRCSHRPASASALIHGTRVPGREGGIGLVSWRTGV